MRSWAALLPLALFSAAGSSQTSPTASIDDPRLQTVTYELARPTRVLAYPGSNLTVMLLPGDRIAQTVLSDPSAFEVKLTAAQDSLNIVPLRTDAAATLVIDTAVRRYQLDLGTADSLAAAYVVRFVAPTHMAQPAPQPPQGALTGEYRLSGERALLPTRIADDGERTYLEWGKYQSLPAVFGVGTTGEEEVVDGYMRGGVFTIDRVYGELVFRVDKKRARARRRGGLG